MSRQNGPIPTSFRFDSILSCPIPFSDGNPFEVTKPEEKFDEAFKFKIKTFSGTAEFRQKIIAKSSTFIVTGELTYGACNNSTCTPPTDVEFSIKISGEPVETIVKALPQTASAVPIQWRIT